jgi:CopG family transcriptional regulator/antitoxin EndoAI
MSEERRELAIRIAEHLAEQLQEVCDCDACSVSNLIEDAICLYLKDRRRRQISQSLMVGYQSMNEFNMELAEEGVNSDQEMFDLYETQLECDDEDADS